MADRARRADAPGGPGVAARRCRGGEGGKGPLLGDEIASRGADRLPLERLVHPFMGAVLLRMGGEDALVLNAEPQPPDVELRESMDAGGGEGHAVVGANGPRQAVLAKEAIEDGTHAVAPG